MDESYKENNNHTYMGTAVVLTKELFHFNDAKTAHGLVRGTDGFRIMGVIDIEDNHKTVGARSPER